MAFQIKIHRLAYQENIDAYEWYESQKEGLGDEYLEAVQKIIERLRKNPEYYSILRDQYRHVKLRKFPFTIVYEISTQNKAVHISAIFHKSRNPRKKFRKEEE